MRNPAPADCKSAIRQTGGLRYYDAPKAKAIDRRPSKIYSSAMMMHMYRDCKFPQFIGRMLRVAGLVAFAAAVGCSSAGKRMVHQPFSTKLGQFRSADVEVKSTVAKPPERFGEFLVQLENRIIADLRIQNVFQKIYSHAADPENTADIGIRVSISSVRNVDNFDRVMWGAFAGQANTKAVVEVRQRATDQLLGSAEVEGVSSGGSVFAGTTGEAVDRVADEVVKIIIENR